MGRGDGRSAGAITSRNVLAIPLPPQTIKAIAQMLQRKNIFTPPSHWSGCGSVTELNWLVCKPNLPYRYSYIQSQNRIDMVNKPTFG